MATSLLFQTIDQLSREKGIDSQIIVAAVEDAVLVATRKYYKSTEDSPVPLQQDDGPSRSVRGKEDCGAGAGSRS